MRRWDGRVVRGLEKGAVESPVDPAVAEPEKVPVVAVGRRRRCWARALQGAQGNRHALELGFDGDVPVAVVFHDDGA